MNPVGLGDIYLALLFPLGNFKQELLKSEAFSKFQEASYIYCTPKGKLYMTSWWLQPS